MSAAPPRGGGGRAAGLYDYGWTRRYAPLTPREKQKEAERARERQRETERDRVAKRQRETQCQSRHRETRRVIETERTNGETNQADSTLCTVTRVLV